MKARYLILGVLLCALAFAAYAAGGKNRLSEVRTDIEEMYLLCEEMGVEQIVVESDDVTVTLRCNPAYGAVQDD
jgi:hypothetical protein